jgi:hypothetical protein
MNYGEFGTTDGQKALEGELHMRKTKFCAGIAVAAMLLVGIAGWANTNNLSLALEAQGPRIDPLQMMREVKDLPIEEWGLH